ncbi:hypothetical protein [Roseovarius sp.]
MTYVWIFLVLYAAVGAIFLLRSKSRGFIADALFALLWPVYLHITRGY